MAFIPDIDAVAPVRLVRRCAVAVAALALLVGLVGCGSNQPDAAVTASTPATSTPAMPTGAPVTLTPGDYTIQVILSGGSGRAAITSPTKLTVTPDKTTAFIVWSSPSYTWMQVDGTKYTPTSAAGHNASFEIPVTLDTDMAVTAETTAMSQPYDIDYTLHFYSSTAQAA